MRGKLFIFLILSGFTLSAQENLADSVQQILNGQIHDTIRAYNLVMLAMYTEPVDMEKAHAIYKEAVDFSLAKDMDYYAGLALYYEVTPYHHSGNRARERENLFRAIELLRNSQHYKAKAQLGAVYGGLSNFYRAIEKTDSAVVASLNSIKILEELKKYRSLSISCMNLAMTYQQLKLPDKQKEYVEKGILNARLSGDKDVIMLSYLQKAHYLTELEDFMGAKACADSATPYFNENYDFSRKQNFYLLKASTFQNVNLYDSAVFYYQKCHDNASEIGSRWNMTEPLMQIGYVFLQKKDYIQAEKYVKMGLEIAEADTIKTFMKEGYGTLSDIYAATGSYSQAYDFLTKFNELKDTLQNEDRKKFILDLEKRYETEKKETQLKLQHLEIEKRKSINHGLLAITSAIVIILILVYLNFRHRNRLQRETILKLEAEKHLSATEAVLKGEEQERSRLAKDLHDGLGGMLSGIKHSLNTMKGNLIMTPDNAQAFERSIDMLDSSIKEMRRVAHNMMPEALVTFGLDTALRDFCNEISQSGALKINYQSIGMENANIGTTASIAIFRIVQELMNNTMKHASAKNAIVQLNKTDDHISVTVEDDGKGFDTSVLNKTSGIGWTNIKNRVEFLNGKLDITSAEGKGTSVYIEIDNNDR